MTAALLALALLTASPIKAGVLNGGSPNANLTGDCTSVGNALTCAAVQPNITNFSSQVTAQSTFTVIGNAFSVGGSTFVVSNSSVSVNGPVDAQYNMKVNGPQYVTGQSIVGGTMTVQGSGLAVNGLAYTWPSSQSGTKVLQNNGSGTLSWATASGEVGTSSATVNNPNSYTTTQTKNSVAFATQTITTAGNPVLCCLNTSCSNDTGGDYCIVGILQDGQWFNGQGATRGLWAGASTTGNAPVSASGCVLVSPAPSAATHSYAFTLFGAGGGTTISLVAANTVSVGFFCKEVK